MSSDTIDSAFIPFGNSCIFLCIAESRVGYNRFDTIIGKVSNGLRRFLAELFGNLRLRPQLLSDTIGIKHTLELTSKCFAVVRREYALLVVIATDAAFSNTTVAIAVTAIAETIHRRLWFIFD